MFRFTTRVGSAGCPLQPITPMSELQRNVNRTSLRMMFPQMVCGIFLEARLATQWPPSMAAGASSFSRSFVPRLQIVQVAEEAVARKQFFERALLDDQPVAQDQNPVSILNRR